MSSAHLNLRLTLPFSAQTMFILLFVRGEVFDLTTVAVTHQWVVSVVPPKAILKYGGQYLPNSGTFSFCFPHSRPYSCLCRSALCAMAYQVLSACMLLWIPRITWIPSLCTMISAPLPMIPSLIGTLRAWSCCALCSCWVPWVHSQGNQEYGQCWEICCYLQRSGLRCH